MPARLRTRLFAARCVLELPLAVGSDPRHFGGEAPQGRPADEQGEAKYPTVGAPCPIVLLFPFTSATLVLIHFFECPTDSTLCLTSPTLCGWVDANKVQLTGANSGR